MLVSTNINSFFIQWKGLNGYDSIWRLFITAKLQTLFLSDMLDSM